MKIKLTFTVTVTVIFGLLILGTQDPFILAGGSELLELTAIPSKNSQWAALLLFFIVSVLSILIPFKKNLLNTCITFGVFTTLIFLLAVSGHSYTYSGRQHALIDRWYFIDLQNLHVNPNNFLNNGEYTDNKWYVSVYEDGQIKQRIITWPFFWGLDKDHVLEILKGMHVTERK